MSSAAPPNGLARGDRANGSMLSRTFVHRQRRGAELFLLLQSLILSVGAYAAVGYGTQGTIPADLLGYGTWLGLLVIGCHVVIRSVARYADPVLLPIVSALNGLGLAMLHRIDQADARAVPDALPAKQLIWMTIGVGAFVAVLLLLRDHRRLQAYTFTSGLAAIGLLLLPMVPGVGKEINGARIWIGIGGFTFQPGEVAKLALVVFFAGYLVLHRDVLALAGRRFMGLDLPRPRDFGPLLLMFGASMLILVGQRDLGSSLLFYGLFIVMLYVATERAGWVVVGTTMFAAGAFLAFRLFPHVQGRVDGWLDPFADPDKYSQIVQGLYGFAWGGMVGQGWGQGSPTLVSYSYSDFILAAIGEELGLTGVLAVLMLYALIVERALRTALVARDNFGKLMAAGLAVVFALQIFVVVGGVTKLIPLTGLTTPFMSYGGSSLVANWAMIALLLRISDQARRPSPELLARAGDESDDNDHTVTIR